MDIYIRRVGQRGRKQRRNCERKQKISKKGTCPDFGIPCKWRKFNPAKDYETTENRYCIGRETPIAQHVSLCGGKQKQPMQAKALPTQSSDRSRLAPISYEMLQVLPSDEAHDHHEPSDIDT